MQSAQQPAIVRRPLLEPLVGIRFAAAFCVLLFHYGAGFAGRSGVPEPIVTFLQNGYLGVSLFFILSGFIITYTYDGKISSRGKVADYFVARFSRIYPVYAFALLIALPFSFSTLTPSGILSVLTFTQAWTPPHSKAGFVWIMQAWTLSVEFFFYLLAPLLLFGLRNLGTRGFVVIAALAAIALPLLWIPTISPGNVNPSLPIAFIPIPVMRSVEFIYGMALCKILVAHREQLRILNVQYLVVANAVFVVGLMASSKNPHVVGCAMALVGVFIVQLALGGGFIGRFFGSRTMQLLGASSYALYLIQWPVREWLRLLPSSALAQALNPIVAVTLSILVFRFWEEPARRFIRRKLFPHKPNRTGADAGSIQVVRSQDEVSQPI